MPTWKHQRSKPVIGLLGGIGSGKSTISRLFASLGCAVIDADVLAHELIQTSEVKAELRHFLGEAAFNADGTVNRRSVGVLVFNDPDKLARLNALMHPRVGTRREELMKIYLADPVVKAIISDTPLLMEAGLYRECDVLVFINTPLDIRLKRVQSKRGWTAEEHARRENLQFPLDKKATFADYCIDNSGDEASSLRQVQRVLSQLLAPSSPNAPCR